MRIGHLKASSDAISTMPPDKTGPLMRKVLNFSSAYANNRHRYRKRNVAVDKIG
jgi:hypothetical protein